LEKHYYSGDDGLVVLKEERALIGAKVGSDGNVLEMRIQGEKWKRDRDGSLGIIRHI